MKKQAVLDYFRIGPVGEQNKGITETAKALGYNKSAISLWPDLVPEMSAIRLDRITKGKLKYKPEAYDQKKAAS